MSKTILCPVNGTDHSDVGLVRAIELAKLMQARLVLCVVNIAFGARGPTINQWNDDEAEAIVAKAESKARSAGLSDVASTVLVSHEAGPAIMAYASETGADQIVMGTGDKRGLKRLVLGSVAADVATHAECTVTVAR